VIFDDQKTMTIFMGRRIDRLLKKSQGIRYPEAHQPKHGGNE
jgi:hypothetical protein